MNLKTYLQTNRILTDAEAADIPYLGVDGRAIVESIMMLKYKHRNIYTGNDDEDDITTLPTDLQSLVSTVFKMHDYNWKKKYATIQLVYNPLNATDYTESLNETNGGKDTITEKEENSGSDVTATTDKQTGTQGTVDTTTNNLTELVSKVTADNRTFKGIDKIENTGDVSNNSTRTDDLTNSVNSSLQHGLKVDKTREDTFGHTITNNKNVTGRDNMTAQDLIKQEREIAEYNFFEMIADEVTDFITTLTYDFS